MIEYTIKIYQIKEKKPKLGSRVMRFDTMFNRWDEEFYLECVRGSKIDVPCWKYETTFTYTEVTDDDYWFELPKDWEGEVK